MEKDLTNARKASNALYKSLQENGYQGLPSEESFYNTLQDSTQAAAIYNSLQENGYGGLPSRESFYKTLIEDYGQTPSSTQAGETEQQPAENAPTFEVGGNGYTFTADELQKMEEGQRPVMKPKYGTPEYGSQKIEGDASNPYAGMTRQQAINAVGKKFFNEWYGKDHTPETTEEVDGEQVKYGGLGAYDQIRAELAANNIVDPENYANVTKDIRRAYIPEVARRRIQQLMGGFESANHWNAEDIRNVLDSREAQQTINQDLERLGFAPTPEAYDGDEVAMHRDVQRYEQARQYYYQQLQNELENVLVNKYGWLPSKDYRSGVESFRDELISGGAEEHEERIRDREALNMVTKYATPQVQKYFNEAEEKGREAYRQALNSVPGVSQASAGTYQNNMGNALGAALYAGYAENKETDPGKIWAAMEPNLKQMGINLINDPGFMKEAETRAAEEGMELGDYLRLRVDPVLESIYQKEFERIAVENEMPKNFVDYALGKMRDSLPGVAINWAVNSPARRRAQQRAMQLTDVGQGKWTPNMLGRIGGGFWGMAPDLALYGAAGKAVSGVGRTVVQELSSAGFRPLTSRIFGSSITGAGTMGSAETAKGFVEGLLNDNDYEHMTDEDDRSFLDVLGGAVKNAVERGVPSAVSGFAMVGNPIAGKIFNGTSGVISNALKIGTQAITDAAGVTAISVISGDIKPEDAGEHFLESFGTFAALALQGHAKEIKNLGNGNRSWNDVEFTKKDIQMLEDFGLDKFRNQMKDIERARNRKGLIGQSLGLEATKEQVEAAKSEGAKLYNEMMRSYAIPYELKKKVAQAMDAPIPDYAVKPEVLELSARVPAESVDLGLVDMLEYEYNREGGVADKVKQGQELDSNELNVRLLFQENKAFNEAVEKLQRGEELTDEEQSLIVRNQRRLNDVQTQYYRLEHERVNREFEAEHGLEPGTMNRLLRDVAEGKAINDANIMKEYEEYLRGVDQRLGDARAEIEARKAAEAEAMAEAEKQAVENTEEQVGGVPENESINKAEVVTENETTPPPPLVMDEKGEVLWEQSPVEATVAGLTERVGKERVGQIVDEEIASLTDELTSLSERRVKNMNERLQREQDIADVAERMVYWQQVKDAIAPKEEAAKPEEAAPETPVVKNEAEIKPEGQKPAEAETPVEGEAPAAPDQPITPPEDAERPAELTAEQKVAQGTVNNNTGKRFGFQNQDGSRSEIVIDGIGKDGKVEVIRQDYDADGRETGDPYKQSLDMVAVGNSIVNGTMKPALTTEEKLRQVHKFDKFKVGDVPLIDVLTDAEQRQVLEALERGDTEAVGNMTPDLIKAHHEDLILKGRDDRNAKVRSIMDGNGSREQKLRKVRELYKGYNDAEVSLEDATLAPTTLEEYVADLHSRVPKSGEGPIAYFSYKQGDTEVTGLQDESGYGKKSSGDADAFKPWLAPKGKGMSLMKYAEQIHSQLPEEIQKQFDVNDVRNAILDVFSAAERPSDITTMILKRGVEQAEQAVRRMEDNWIEGGLSYQKVSADDNSFAGRLTRAKEQTNAEPTEKQKAAGNYKKGHVSFGGYDFVVENPEGSVRRGEADGRKWENKMNNTYGYILGKRGKDGDHLDMFINDAQDLDNFDGKVYVIDQVNPKTGEFDEHKIMYGFDSEEAARDAYLSNYEEGWQGLGRITGVDKDTFDKWLDSSDKKIKAFAEHSIIRDAVSKPETKKAVTNAEIDKAFVTELDKEMKNAGVKVADTLEEVEEGQAVLDAFNGEAKMMGTTTRNRQNNIASELKDKELSAEQQTVVDVFTGKDNQALLKIEDVKGKERSILFTQGNDKKAGAKHSIFRHNGTNKNWYTAEEVTLIPDVIHQGKRTQEGNRVSYTLDKDGVKFTVTTLITGKKEKFTNFFTNRKPNAAEQGTQNTANQRVQPQQTASEKTGADGEVSTHSDATQANPTFSREDLGAVFSDAKLRKENETSKNLEEKNKEASSPLASNTPEGAHSFGDDVSSGAKVQENSETGKDSWKKFFKTPEGHAYGFTYKGKIYVDPRIATAETPIHEYGHLWAEMKRQTSPKEWDAIKEALLNDKVIDPFIEKVRNEYPELLGEGREDDFIEEVLTQFSGKHGAERLRRMAEEIKAELGGDATAETIAQAAIRRVKSVLNDFWKGVCNMMGWKYTNAEDVADTILRDMLNGVNPNDVIAKAREGRAAENPRIKSQLVGEKGAAEADKAEGSTVRQDNKAIAEEMEKEGKDAKAIKFATGWERGKDGKWRYETTDAKVDILTPYEKRVAEMKEAGIDEPSPVFKLSELMGKDNELFKYYPKLKDMEVMIGDFLPDGVAGSFDGSKIELNAKETNRIGDRDLDNESVYGTLLHEVQHAVQDIEGFAKGGSLSTATTEEGLQAIVDRKQQQRADLKQRIDANEAILNSPEFSEYAELAGMDKDAYFEKLTDNNDKMAVEYDRLKLQIDRINKLKTVSKSDAIDLYHSLAGEVEARNATERAYLSDEQRRNKPASETEDVSRDKQVVIMGDGESASMGDGPETFEERQKRAVREKGVVRPGLADESVNAVQIKEHTYTGDIKEATRQAAAAAKKKYAPDGKPAVQHYDNYGKKFEYIISGRAISESLNPKQQAKSENKGAHLSMAEHLDEIINNSIEVEEHPDYPKNENGEHDGSIINPDALMHRFYGVVEIDGKPYRVMTLMREDKVPQNKDGLYAYEVQKIEVLNDETPSTANGVDSTKPESLTYPLAKVLQNVEKSKDSGKYLLDESKKNANIDNNGEENAGEKGKDAVDRMLDEVERRKGLPKVQRVGSNDKIRYVDQMKAEEKDDVRKRLEDKEAIPAAENAITKREGMSARNVAMEWADKNIPNPKTVGTEIGDLVINKKSISDSLAHGFSQAKLDAIPTLLPAFEEGRAVYIGSGEDNNGDPITDHYFAYPIDYKGNREYVFCRTREDQNTHRLYIHEVITGEDIEKGQTLQSTAPEKPRTGLPLYRSIMYDVFGSKGKKNNDTLQINDEENAENLLREGDAITIPLSRKKLTPKEQRARAAFAERQWRRAHDRVAESIEKLKLTDNVTVVDSVDELPNADKIPARQRRAKGWYDPDTGKIVIVMGNHRSPDDVVRTVLHEGVAHHGLRKLFGKNFDQFLTNAYGSATKEISEEIDKLAEGKYDGDKNKATEEYLARLAEDTDFENAEKKPWVHHWFNQIKDAFLDMLKKIGLPGMKEKEGFLTDNELRYILWRSYKNLSEPGRYRNVFGGEMAKKLGVAEPAKVVRMGHIEDEIPLTILNHNDEIAIRERVQKMSLAEAEKAYKRINDKMLDEDGLDIDEHYEKIKQDWYDAHGLNGIGKVMADALQASMDKYGSGMVELRWALLDRIEELKASESTPLLREGEEEADGKDAVDRMLDEVERRKNMPKYQRVEGSPEPELTPEERQYWKKYEEDLKKWKARNGMKEDAQEPMAVPRMNAGESATDYAKRVMDYAKEKAKWKTAPHVEDYRQRRLDKDMLEEAREEEKRYPDSQRAKMRRAAAEYQQIRTRIGQQKAYDKATVKAVTDFAQDLMKMGFGDNLTKGKVSRLLSSVKNATGASSVKKEMDDIMNTLMDSYLLDLENRLVKLSSVKELNQTAQGVEKQGKLELKGQRMIQAFREARQGRWDAETLRERLEKIDEDIDKDPEGADMYEQEREGFEIALQYVKNIEKSRQDWERINSEYKEAVRDYKISGRTYQEQQEFLDSLERAMQENKMERIAMYGDIMGRLQGNIDESVQGAKEFRERERERTKLIHAIANFDLAGMDSNPFRDSKDEKGRKAKLFFSPLGTFEQMLKQFGGRNAKGEGYLYDYYLRNWMDSTNRAYEGEEQAKMELDEKAQSVFGDEKVKRWSDIYKLVQNEKKMPGMEVEVLYNGERKQLHLTQGNMLYIYMVNKMNDGAMKLRKMGITEEDVAKIKENLDERLVELGDWLQDEYLPAKRVKYNQVHERMFGAPMAAIDHYFPIKVLGDARQQDVDMNDAFNKNALPSTITGSIIKRKRNTTPLDILHTDALSLAIEHIEEMEQWAAMAEWKRDISTLLSYTTFRNKVKNMKTIYGSGEALWRNFFDAASIAAGEYQPKRGDADKAVTNIAKGVTSAKINFRLYTAFKQILSAPAFLHDVRLDDFIKNSFNPYGSWKWAMENMPVFRKRVNSRKAGDTRLEDTEEDWKLWKKNFMKLAMRYGMSANAFVDAVTCAVGARSIYETRYRKYLKMGADEEKARQRAMQDAEIGYNLTQQSSEGAFVSKIQKDRTVAANMLTVFRNGPMSYGRQEYDAYRNLKRMLKADSEEKEDRINFMARQLEEGLGLNSEQAQEAARRQYNRAMWHELGKLMNMAFGVTVAWNLGASLPYLLMGDDWETKAEMLKDALLKGLAGPVEGFAGGNLISDMVGLATSKEVRNAFGESFDDGISAARKSLSNYEINPLPLLADLDKLLGKSGGDVYEFANDLFNIWAQSYVGFNPQTFTDFWNACVDYGFVDNIPLLGAGVDPSLHNQKGLLNAREIALFLMRATNAPTSSWKNKLIDELGADINIDEAKRMTYDELAKRYANYKGWKDAPLTGFLRSDESREEMLKKKEEQFKKAVQERLDNLSNKEVVDLDIKRQDDAGLHKSVKKQLDKRAEKMSEEELQYLFDNVFLIDERKTVGKELASRLGFDGEKDEDGKKEVPTASDADYFMRYHNSGKNEDYKLSKRFYVTERSWADIAEDLELEVIKRDAKAAGDEATADAVDAAKEAMMGWIKQIGNNATTLWDGTVNDEEYRWKKIRETRSKVLEKYGKKKDRKPFFDVSFGEQPQEKEDEGQ